MAQVLYAQSAQTDLLEAWLFIAEENMPAADRVLEAIEHEAETLSLQPKMGRARPELGKAVRSCGHRLAQFWVTAPTRQYSGMSSEHFLLECSAIKALGFIVSNTGHMAVMNTISPTLFVALKKRPKDALQATLVRALIDGYMPQYYG